MSSSFMIQVFHRLQSILENKIITELHSWDFQVSTSAKVLTFFCPQKICRCTVLPIHSQPCGLLAFLSRPTFLCLWAALETCSQIPPFAKGCEYFILLFIHGVGMECLSSSLACSGASRWLLTFQNIQWDQRSDHRHRIDILLLFGTCFKTLSSWSCGSQSATSLYTWYPWIKDSTVMLEVSKSAILRLKSNQNTTRYACC